MNSSPHFLRDSGLRTLRSICCLRWHLTVSCSVSLCRLRSTGILDFSGSCALQVRHGLEWLSGVWMACKSTTSCTTTDFCFRASGLKTLCQSQFRLRQSPSRAISKMLVPASGWQEGRLPLFRELDKKMATLRFPTLG